MAKLTLPDTSPLLSTDFIFGTATASFQIEGAADKRLSCIWDTFCDTEGKIADNSHGKTACDHYHKWQQDVDLLEELGVDAYRLSISWPRVMTQEGQLNDEGVSFYRDLLTELKRRNIKTFVTLYHWDLPQYLEDQGGWLNRQTAYAFQHYVDCISKALAGLVDSYATLNEPFCSAYLGYEAGIHAPGKVGKENGRKASHHLLLAHGLAMQVLQQNSPTSLNGIVLNFTPAYPASDSNADLLATQFADDYYNQWYIKPLFDGDYPAILAELPPAHQPDIHPGDMQIIAQPLDFLGVNYYTRTVYQADEQEGHLALPAQAPLTDIGWEIYPQAFTDLLVSLNEKYNLPPIFITENGCAMDDKISENKVDDHDRLDYYQLHLNAVNDAIAQGVDIKGYFAWSLMDNFEWAEGYAKRFGLVYVDYQTLERTIKLSGRAYQTLLARRHPG